MSIFQVQFGQYYLPLSIMTATPGASVGSDPDNPTGGAQLLADHSVNPGAAYSRIILGLPESVINPGQDFHFTTAFAAKQLGIDGGGRGSNYQVGLVSIGLNTGDVPQSNGANQVFAAVNSYSMDFHALLAVAGFGPFALDSTVATDTSRHVYEISWDHTLGTFSFVFDGAAPIPFLLGIDISGPMFPAIACLGFSPTLVADLRIDQFKVET